MFSNWQLTEISNFLSDILLAAFLFYWSVRLKNLDIPKSFNSIWALFFLLIGASAFVGGWGHLLSLHIDKKGLLISWTLSILAVLSLEIGLLKALEIPSKWQWGLYLKALIFIILTIFYENFVWVKIDMTLGIMGIVLPILLKFYRVSKDKAYSIIILGLLTNGLSGAVHTLNIGFSSYFDHRDLAHVVSILCFGIVFWGIKQLEEPEEIVLEG